MAIVAVSDPSVPLPSGTDPEALVRALEPMSRASQVFYLVTDDPVQCRLDILVNEQPTAEIGREFEAAGGSFGLRLPSGRLAVSGWDIEGRTVVAGTVETEAGAHVLSVLARRPVDGGRHAEDMTALLGAEWTYMQRIDRLGLVGCLPLVLLAATVFAQNWHWLWVVLPLLAASWAPYLLLRQGRRYKAAERRAAEFEKSRPHYVFTVSSTDRDALAGGFLRI